jgi:hypothetical protein
LSGFAEKRKFFLEIIDDMAREEVETARVLDQVAEGIDDSEPGAPPEDDDLGPTPESLRGEIEAASDEELLMQRRVAAKAVCQYVSDVGFLDIPPIHAALLATVELLKIIDEEVVRRRLVADHPTLP